MPRMTQTRRAQKPSGFTLVELLVVMAIIALVISILLPALGGARNAAKTAATLSISSDVVKAAESFQLDNRRMAGKFSAAEMGDKENANTQGLSGMENLMLDLAGGVVGEGTVKPAKYPNSISIAPKDPAGGKIEPVWVDPGLIGAQGVSSGKSYYLPQAKYYAKQLQGSGTDDIGQKAGNGPSGKTEADAQLPDVIDAWGNPLLAWTEDESAGSVNTLSDFAAIDSTSPAHFYWNQNAAFLQATALGRSRTNQTMTAPTDKHSLIGKGVQTLEIQNTMTVLLGNPNLAVDVSKDPVLPARGRGRIVVHSAGTDGYYFGSADRGAKRAAGGKLLYGMNFYKTGLVVKTERLKDRDGKETTFDLKDDFDDIVIAGGN